MAAESVRAAPLLRMCMEVMRDMVEPAPAREVLKQVAEKVTLTEYELEPIDKKGQQPRWENHMRWQTGDAATIGWVTKVGGWSLTEAGVLALDTFPGDGLFTELRRRLAETLRQRKLAQQQLTGEQQTIDRALARVGPGFWTSIDDLAELTGTQPTTIAHFLAQTGPTGAHRVLNPDGSALPQGQVNVNFRGVDIPARLAGEGVEFDEHHRASPEQRITAADLGERLAETEPESAFARRAWLVRGSSVEGRDLVPVWLRKGSVSLAASGLRPVSAPIDLTELKSFVDQDYQHKPYSVREAKTAEFHAFVNRMREDDMVLTTTHGSTYLGRISGSVEYVASSDQRSNLRRNVKWLNDTDPVSFRNLPEPLPAKLANQSDVVDLTEVLATIDALLGHLGILVTEPAPAPQQELTFRPISDDVAKRVTINKGWLQQQVDLLRRRRQLIFYGPPGTGKTYLAQELAEHLAEPSAVKLVQFHPSYTYEDFFEGLRPKQDTQGHLTYELRPGPFRSLVDDARDKPSDPYVLIIDEINRANLAKVFGELYFLLEYRNKPVSLMYSAEQSFTLPENVFVIGTMNTADRSITTVDAAMRRRFAFVELHPSTDPIRNVLRTWLKNLVDEGGVQHHQDAADVLDALNREIADHNLAIGPSFLMRPDTYQRADGLAEVWNTAILPLLAEHHYGSAREVLDRYRLDRLRKNLGPPG